jgi:hypothetical protein
MFGEIGVKKMETKAFLQKVEGKKFFGYYY